MTNRVNEVVSSIVEAVRGAIRENDVTFDEYGQAIGYLMQTAEAGELPLMVDMFFNTTIVENTNKNSKASTNDLLGPFFLEDVPVVTNGQIKTMEQFDGEPMLMRGQIKTPDGDPVPNAEIFIWSSTPDGKYSGFHDNIPVEYYRGKLVTDDQGAYSVSSTVPVPYQLPNPGPASGLLEAMGGHCWRPAHIHYRVRKDGFKELVTQAYFEGGDYVGDDCCSGMHTNEFVMPKVVENGVRVVDIDFTVEQNSAA